MSVQWSLNSGLALLYETSAPDAKRVSVSPLQGVCGEEGFVVLFLLRTLVEERPLEEQRRFAAGAQLVQQGEPRYQCLRVLAHADVELSALHVNRPTLLRRANLFYILMLMVLLQRPLQAAASWTSCRRRC